MKKRLIILTFLLLGCAGEENIIKVRFPDSISAIKKDVDYIFITSKGDRKYLLITEDGKKIDDGEFDCIPVSTVSFFQKFFIFCENEKELKVEIYTHEAQKNTLRLITEIPGIFTGAILCEDKICFSVKRDVKTEFREMEEEEITMVSSHDGICTQLSASQFICDGFLYPHGFTLPAGSFVFPDSISGPLLVSGREVWIIKDEKLVKWRTLSAHPLSFLSFENFIAFFDVLGYARIIDRKTQIETSISCGSYPVSATGTSEERVYVLNEINPSITVLDLKGMREIKTIW